MQPVPSLPFWQSASLPEVIWIVAAAISVWLTWRAWRHKVTPVADLKNGIRFFVSLSFLLNGIAVGFNPPSASPSYLSVITPFVIAFGVFSMAMLAVIDEQNGTKEDA